MLHHKEISAAMTIFTIQL